MSMIFVTGGTGYLGSYAVARLVEEHGRDLALLIRARNRQDAVAKLWRGLQMHMDAQRFERVLTKVRFVPGDLTAPGLGLEPRVRDALTERATSVLHIAASLNRKSEKACLNANLRGTLSVVQVARAMEGRGRLDRFTHVSTVAVAGRRDREVVEEDLAIDWERSDYDPYGRTKKFCEHMVRELLPNTSKVFLRPSIVMGDTRFPQTTQFDMVRSFCMLADLPVLPMRGDTRLDIVNADYVGRAIADVHIREKPRFEIYHLASGESSKTADAIGAALLSKFPSRRPPKFAPRASGPFAALVDRMANLPRGTLSLYGSLMKVFWPYIVYDTVFDHRRIVEELGSEPTPFTEYCGELYAWSKRVGFEYPYVPLPERIAARAASEELTRWD